VHHWRHPAQAGVHAGLLEKRLVVLFEQIGNHGNRPISQLAVCRVPATPANQAGYTPNFNSAVQMSETLEQRAVARCTDEIARAVLYLRAWRGIAKAKTYHGVDFIYLAHLAFYDQTFAHALKVLAPSKSGRAGQDLGLWFLVRRRKATVARLCAAHGIFLGHVRRVGQKLKIIRDKTHFHLDEKGVRHPGRVWKAAGLTKKQFDDALDASLRLLLLLHIEIRGVEYPMPWYDGSDAFKITQHAYVHRMLCVGEPPDPKFSSLFE
jgi:hypothetical protein